MLTQLKGLNAFITDIRACQNKEQEQTRCEQELAKIKTQFANNRNMSGYHKKKYIWKLLYMYILGYEIDFGLMDAAFLINCGKFSEKYTGYIATSILVNEENQEIYETIKSSVKADLNSSNEIYQSLALAMIGSQAPYELVKYLAKDVVNLAIDVKNKVSFFVKKKAILCLLRMFRKYNDLFNPSEWIQPIILMFDQVCWSLGFLSSITTIVHGISSHVEMSQFTIIVPRVIKLLEKLVVNKDCPKDYLYYQTPNPWVQVKLLKLLQVLELPAVDSDHYNKLVFILQKIIQKTEVTKHQNKNNADHAILFEAANLILINYDRLPKNLKNETLQLLGIFIQVKVPNVRYLALETVCKFNDPEACNVVMKDYLKHILSAMKDNDISIKRRALDILYHMCNTKIAHVVVEEMLNFIEFADVLFKEELVLKVAILAEKFADDLEWYLNVMLKLIEIAGELITNDVCHRIIQIITGFGNDDNSKIQKYSCNKLFGYLQKPYVNNSIVKIGCYILTEFSQYIVKPDNSNLQDIYDILYQHFQQSDNRTKCLMLNGFAKLAARYNDLEGQVMIICQQFSDHYDSDLQSRALEFLCILQEDENMKKQILATMPTFSSSIQNQNQLVKKIYKLKGETKKDRDPTVINQSKKLADEEFNMFKTKSTIIQQNQQQQEAQKQFISKLQNHQLYEQCLDMFNLNPSSLNSQVIPQRNEGLNNVSNSGQLKQLFSQPNGQIYSDNNLIINYKSEFNQSCGKIAMQFECKQEMKDISIMIQNASNMQVNVSPVKYQDKPVVMIEVISNAVNIGMPVASVFYQSNNEQHKIEFVIPINQIKFTQPVELQLNTINGFFKEYTFGDNSSYFRLDDFIKNPAPASVNVQEVLKKMGSLMQALNLNVQAVPSMQQIETLSGTGQYHYKGENNTVQNAPILVQIQSYSDSKTHFRFSIRAAASESLLQVYFQIFSYIIGI